MFRLSKQITRFIPLKKLRMNKIQKRENHNDGEMNQDTLHTLLNITLLNIIISWRYQ